MRIDSIDIRSYGNIRDRKIELGEGLNVFYGPNESGKTSTMEFIRNTLVPTNKNKTYPERAKTDSGRIVYTEGGVRKELELEYRTVKGETPQCVVGMDPETYRSVFAMNPSDLDGMNLVSSGEIRSRFLTIPGGESIPEVISSIEKDIDRYVGKKSNSPSELNAIKGKENEIFAKIGDLRKSATSYSELVETKEALLQNYGVIKEANEKARKNNEYCNKVDSLRTTYDRLAYYKGEKDRFDGKRTASQNDIGVYSDLKAKFTTAKDDFANKDLKVNQLKMGLPGSDETRVMNQKPRLEGLVKSESEYNRRKSLHYDQPHNVPVRIGTVIVCIAAIAAIFLLLDIDTVIKAASAGALAAVMAAVLYLTRDKNAALRADNEGWISNYESSVIRCMQDLGMEHRTVELDLDSVLDILSTTRKIGEAKADLSDSRMAMTDAENKLLGFLMGYGGEEGFKEAQENARKSNLIDSNIQALQETIVTSGFDPNKALPTVERMEVNEAEQADMDRTLGEIEARMEYVLDTKELDSLIDSSYTLRSERDRVLRQGAKALLQSYIVEDACSELYGSVHPAVLSTADEYLGMMTSGTSRFDADPRNKEITIVSKGDTKESTKWSSGLRAQVLLSLKLAVAKEMGSGEIPVILDDVLLPFDSERKLGAFKALSQLSADMQILLFTCDDRVLSMAEEQGTARVIHMNL